MADWSSLYGVITAGAVSITNSSSDGVQHGQGTGYTGEAHIGYSYEVWKGICINAQAGVVIDHNNISGQSTIEFYPPDGHVSYTETMICFPGNCRHTL